jgi:hypothetical protein
MKVKMKVGIAVVSGLSMLENNIVLNRSRGSANRER